MKIIKNVYLYRDSHLPEQGWLQSCFRCYSITSKLYSFKTIENKKKIYQFKIYMCPSCQKKINNDEDEFNKFSNRANKYIDGNY
tara:strand:- start:506 stop:757 length:252 start_codon:yes stop_codon:yes gene_type:complete